MLLQQIAESYLLAQQLNATQHSQSTDLRQGESAPDLKTPDPGSDDIPKFSGTSLPKDTFMITFSRRSELFLQRREPDGGKISYLSVKESIS